MDQQTEPEFGNRMSAYSSASVTKTESAGVAWSSVLRAWDDQICLASDPAVIAAYTTQVRAEWQAAVECVAEAHGFDERRKKNVLLCSPYWMFSWWKGGRQWRCNLPNICPWCWSGRVVGIWDRLVELMYVGDGSGPAEKSLAYDVISLISTFPSGGRSVDDFRTALAVRCGGVGAGELPALAPRQKDVERSRPAAFVELCSPMWLGGREWGLRIRQLILKPAGRGMPSLAVPPGVVAIQYLNTPTRSQLADTVANTFRYPKALWTVSVEDLRAIKEACEGRKVLSTSGALRGKKAAAKSE